MSNADRVLLSEMIDAVDKIEAYIGGFDIDRFLSDGLTADAVALNLLVIGEGAARLSGTTRDRAADIPWGDLSGLRNRIAHGYSRIDLRIVWRIVSTDLPPLGGRLRALSVAVG